jgi:hypothetical protein
MLLWAVFKKLSFWEFDPHPIFHWYQNFPKEDKCIHISVNKKNRWGIWTWDEGHPSCTYNGLLHTRKEMQAFRLILGTLYRLSSLLETLQLLDLLLILPKLKNLLPYTAIRFDGWVPNWTNFKARELFFLLFSFGTNSKQGSFWDLNLSFWHIQWS